MIHDVDHDGVRAASAGGIAIFYVAILDTFYTFYPQTHLHASPSFRRVRRIEHQIDQQMSQPVGIAANHRDLRTFADVQLHAPVFQLR